MENALDIMSSVFKKPTLLAPERVDSLKFAAVVCIIIYYLKNLLQRYMLLKVHLSAEIQMRMG